MPNTETPIKKTIFDGIRSEFPRVKVFPVFVGSARGSSHRFIQGAPTGTPDICGFLPDGRFLGIECKTKTGTYKPEQHEFAISAAKAGAVVFGATSWEEAREKLEKEMRP